MNIETPLSGDEVIADSEEEIEFMKSFPAHPTPQRLGANAVSSISEFTATAYGARSDEIEAHSIADRTKTRHRTQGTKKKPIVSEVIELTSDDDTEECTKSVKPKPKAKVKAKQKVAEKPLPSANTSAHVEVNSERPRPRPRPRPIIRGRTKSGTDPLPPHPYPFTRDPLIYDMPGIRLPPSSTPQADLPIATLLAINDYGMPPSQLPPSDPPNSTMTTAIGERPESDALPPIEILRDGSGRDGDTRLSSPGSLFSDMDFKSTAKSKKRKREAALEIQDNEYEVDQLIPSSPHRPEASLVSLPVLDAYNHEQDLPPTFFAGSSSLSRCDGRDPHAISTPQVEVVDLTDLPPTLHCSKSSIPSKKKKLKINTETDAAVDPGADGDSDFEPAGRKTTKRKRKGKEPAKGVEIKPKEKKERIRKKKEQLEGVVLQPKAKIAKTKAKEKQPAQEIFKSREFIDNSDEDLDPLLLVGGMQVECIPSPKALIQDRLPSSNGRSLQTKVDGPHSTISVSAGSKEKAKPKSKKRKSIVESDDEESEKGGQIQEKDCTVLKRRNPTSSAVLSDEGEQEGDDVRNNGRSAEDKPEVQKSPQGSGAVKTIENIYGVSEPPLRPLASRASSIIPNVSTPLYTRYEVAPRRSSLPMTELIRRASSKPGSLFPPPASVTPSRNKGKSPVEAASTTPVSITAYSPYLKMSRRALSKIAPLHLTRKTPPPPPPPPPPKKKTKKELEMEERWEEELVESVGGIEVWASMGDSERKEMRRAKRGLDLAGYDE